MAASPLDSPQRHFRYRSTNLEAAAVSFVAVRHGWRGQGVASGLYHALLQALADLDVPVVTYGIPGSAGDKTLLHAYPEAGFRMHVMGMCSNYAFVCRRAKADGEWMAHFSADSAALAAVAEQLSVQDPAALCSMPDPGHLAHYLTDPRPRKLIVVENAATGVRGAAFVVHSELRTVHGFERVTTLDSLWMPGGLTALLQLASGAWPPADGSLPVVTCPNLSGFAASALQAAGVRKTGAQFCGYFCVRGQPPWPAPERTNLEIV